MPTSALKGNAFVLKMPTTASGSDYAIVAACKTTQLTVDSSDIDITNKSSGAWREVLSEGGTKSATISASGIFVDDTSQNRVRAAAFSGALWNAQIVDEHDNTYAGTWKVSSFSLSGETNSEQTFEVSLSSSGVITFTAGD